MISYQTGCQSLSFRRATSLSQSFTFEIEMNFFELTWAWTSRAPNLASCIASGYMENQGTLVGVPH